MYICMFEIAKILFDDVKNAGMNSLRIKESKCYRCCGMTIVLKVKGRASNLQMHVPTVFPLAQDVLFIRIFLKGQNKTKSELCETYITWN